MINDNQPVERRVAPERIWIDAAPNLIAGAMRHIYDTPPDADLPIVSVGYVREDLVHQPAVSERCGGVIEGPSSTEYDAWLQTRPDIQSRFRTVDFTPGAGYEIWRNSWLRLREIVATTGTGTGEQRADADWGHVPESASVANLDLTVARSHAETFLKAKIQQLEPYTEHKPECRSNERYPSPPCDCGLVAALTAPPAAAAEGEAQHHKLCSIWTVDRSGKSKPCDCVCTCGHTMSQHVRRGQESWFEECLDGDCRCMEFKAALAEGPHHQQPSTIAPGEGARDLDDTALRGSVEITIFRGSQILAVNNRNFGGFCGVGGKVEAGETFEQAARRELMEETGCEARSIQFVAGHTLDPIRGDDAMIKWYCAGFVVDIGDQEPRQNEDGTTPFWTTRENMVKNSLFPEWYAWWFRVLDRFGFPPTEPTQAGVDPCVEAGYHVCGPLDHHTEASRLRAELAAVREDQTYARAQLEELRQYRDGCIALLNPASADESLDGAIRNLQQAYIAERDNAIEARAPPPSNPVST